MLLPRTMADLIANIIGRCCCPCVWDGNSTLLRILIILLSKVADVIAINLDVD